MTILYQPGLHGTVFWKIEGGLAAGYLEFFYPTGIKNPRRQQLMNLLTFFFATLACIGVLYQFGAYFALVFFLKRPLPGGKQGLPPGISLLKPVKGLEADTYDCLASFVQQDYPDIQVLLGVADPSDPVLPVLRELQEKNPGKDIQVIICPEELGLNPKISTLRQLLPQARYDLLVISDSDVRARPDLLTRLAAALQQPGVGPGHLSVPFRAGTHQRGRSGSPVNQCRFYSCRGHGPLCGGDQFRFGCGNGVTPKGFGGNWRLRGNCRLPGR